MKLYLLIDVETAGDAYQIVHACRKHMTVSSGKLQHAELENQTNALTKVVRKLYP